MIYLIEKILWLITSSLIIISSIYFTFKLNFVQTKVITMFKELFKKNKVKDSISPLQSLMLVLAGRIGVGSIAGVAIAIYYGGPGTIFWMWIICFLSASITFAETLLGVYFKEKDEKNINRGGPSYYLSKGLNKKVLGNIYAILIILSYVGGFLSIQSNTITKSIQNFVNINSITIGIVICVLTSFIIFGGIKKIAKVSTTLVPLMTIIYVITALFITIINSDKIIDILVLIIKDAFNFKSVTGGILGTIVIGIQRGIFSSEAGLGTCTIASSLSQNKDIRKQCFIQMLGVYITSIFVCGITGLVILNSNYYMNSFSDVNVNNWFNTSVSTLTRLGLINGYSDGTFKPNQYITRAEFVSLMVAFFEAEDIEYQNIFTDISESNWYYRPILIGVNKGFIAGYPDGTFKPNQYITRAEACKIVNSVLCRKPIKSGLYENLKVWPDLDKNAWYYLDVMEATHHHIAEYINENETWNNFS